MWHVHTSWVQTSNCHQNESWQTIQTVIIFLERFCRHYNTSWPTHYIVFVCCCCTNFEGEDQQFCLQHLLLFSFYPCTAINMKCSADWYTKTKVLITEKNTQKTGNPKLRFTNTVHCPQHPILWEAKWLQLCQLHLGLVYTCAVNQVPAQQKCSSQISVLQDYVTSYQIPLHILPNFQMFVNQEHCTSMKLVLSEWNHHLKPV